MDCLICLKMSIAMINLSQCMRCGKAILRNFLIPLGKHSWLNLFLVQIYIYGAIISVADCKVTSYTGVSGIMICETAETFGIITQDDKFRARSNSAADSNKVISCICGAKKVFCLYISS